tara:strand:+ start:267 stop:587 length:321 start_codon:yes stop_codon:yes gene_type:complete
MDDPTLFMLCDPKKCKKIQNNMDAYMNSYEIHSNNLNEDEKSESDNDISETSIENMDNEIPEHMVEVINHINHIDTFILNNKYDIHMEKINDYLIDLLFLIKSKKK